MYLNNFDSQMKSLIEEIISKVFPVESLVTWDTDKIPLEKQFWAIVSQQKLRWIIPKNPEYGLPVIQQWRPYGSLSYFKWMILIALYRIGKLDKIPGVMKLGVIGGFSENWQHLGNKTKQKLIPTIYVGTPSTTRKAVAFLLDSDTHKLCGVAKVPLAAKAGDRIIKEIDTLNCLATKKPDLTPQQLFIDRKRAISVQTPIIGKPVTKELSLAHLKLLSNLIIPDKTTSISKQAKRLQQQLRSLTNFDLSEYQLIERSIATLNNSNPLPETWIHGDFTPWNLKWVAPQKLAALDWEEARPNGLPLQDLFHFLYIQSHLLQPNPRLIERTFTMPIVGEYLQSLGIDRCCYLQLAKFYLVNSWIRSVEKGDFDYAAFAFKEITDISTTKI